MACGNTYLAMYNCNDFLSQNALIVIPYMHAFMMEGIAVQLSNCVRVSLILQIQHHRGITRTTPSPLFNTFSEVLHVYNNLVEVLNDMH